MENTGPPKRQLVLECSIFMVSFLILGCSSLLPSVKESTRVRWQSFDETKEAYEAVIPYETSMAEFHAIGFDPYGMANIKILSYLDVVQRFLPNSSINKEDLPPGVQECINAQGQCHAYELDIVNLYSRRYGDVMADLFNFRRKTHRSGWTFKALFVMVDGVVVYKLWSGNPLIDENVDRKNPLGPLQQSEDIFRSEIIK